MGVAVTRRYGLYGTGSKDFLTFGGRIIWHHDRDELEFVCPPNAGTATVREIPRHIPDELMLPLRDHPRCEGWEWPIARSHFRRTAA